MTDLLKRRVVPGLIALGVDEQYKQAGMGVLQKEADANIGFSVDSISRSFTSGDNIGYEIGKRILRERGAAPAVPGFDPRKAVDAQRGVIPGEYIKGFLYSRSPDEFNTHMKDMQAELHDRAVLEARGGVGTFVARGLAGIVDIDTPIAFMSGGLGMAAKADRWARMGSAALKGGASQMTMATAGVMAGPAGNWSDIPAAGLGGMAFGIMGSAFKKGSTASPEQSANDAFAAAHKEFSDTLDEGAPLAERDMRTAPTQAEDTYRSVATENAELAIKNAQPSGAPKAFSLDDLEQSMPNSVGERGSSVGARQLNAPGSIANITDTRALDIVQDAQTWARTSGVPKDYFDNNGALSLKGDKSAAVSNAARRFHDVVQATPLATDFDRMFKSGSVVAQRLAYDIFENASGIVRNNRSATMLKDMYEKQSLGTFMPHYQDAFSQWATSNKVSRWGEIMDASVRDKFNREVMTELNGRAFDPAGTSRGVHPAVKRVADAHDEWSKLDVEIGRGRPNEHSIKGYETLQAYAGYVSQKWTGAKFNRLIQSGQHTRENLRDAIAEAYVSMHSIGKRDATLWADAVVRRSMASDRGTDLNMIGILQQDGRGYLEEMLSSNGLPAKDIEKMIDRLTGNLETRGQAGHTKGRIDLDLRFIASNGVHIMDLVDTDVAKMVSRRSRGTAGAAALARKGIRSRSDRQSITDAILHEQQARGQSTLTGDKTIDLIDSDKHLTSEHIQDLLSYFDAGPIAGGVSPIYSRMKKLTNLALLNQLGLTQMAEIGVQISAVGWKRWSKHVGEAFNSALGNPDSPLVRELKHLHILVPEEKLFRDDFAIEMDKIGTANSEFMQRVDHVLNTGQRVQGYISGFYAARSFQQRVAVTSAADKIMQNMAGFAEDLSLARAADIGLDPATYAKVKSYVDNGTVEFKGNSVQRLNMDKWDATVAEDFSISLNRHVHQVVQKAMAGESSVLFHKDGVASLFFHLKSFPILAMEKQAYRNARIGDTEAMYSFLFGLATAGAAYTVKQTINGRTDNLTADKIARGAIGMSNMAGWIPMWTDPLASMLGMDSLKFNSYAQGIDSNVLSTPAALPTLNKMANAAFTPLRVLLNGEITNSDIRALQATPIIGNAFGFTAMFNALKDTKTVSTDKEAIEPLQSVTKTGGPLSLDRSDENKIAIEHIK